MDTNAPDAYQQYINTGSMGGGAAPQYASGSPGTYTPPPAPAGPPPLPYYSDDVDAAIAKAKADGTPLTPDLLANLPHHYWTRNAPLFADSGMGKSKQAHDDARASFLQGAQDYNNKIMAEHAAKADPSAPATGFWDKLGQGAQDMGRVALDSTGQGVGEAGRLVGGGLAAIGGAAYNAATGGHADPAGAYFNWYDHNVQTPQDEANLAQDKAAAAQRSPFMGGVLGSLPSAILTAGVAPTMSGVQEERNAGGSVGQQQGMLAVGTLANSAAMALPFTGGAVGEAVQAAAAKGLSGTAARAAVAKAVSGNVLRGAARGAGINAGVGVGQMVAAHAIDPTNNPLTASGIGTQAAIGALLGGVHGKMEGRAALDAAAKLPGAAEPAAVGTLADGSTAVQDPTTLQTGVVPPAAAAPPGTGVPPAAHGALMAELGQKAASTVRRAKDRYAGMAPEQQLPTLMSESAALAQNAAGDSWGKMTPVQQAQTVGAAASAMGRGLRIDGVDAAVGALETQAATAKAPAAQVSETAQPDLGPGDQPVVRTAADPNGPAPVPGMEDAPPGATPEDAQAIAEKAMADQQSPNLLGDLTPPDATGRTRAQAGSPAEIAAHNRADTALKAGGSGLTDANLALMPYKNKVARLEKVGAARITEALPSKRSDANLSAAAKDLHDTMDAQLEPLRRNVLGSKLPKRTLDKMSLQDKVAAVKKLQGQHLEGTMTPDDIRQMLEHPPQTPDLTQPHAGASETVDKDGTHSFDPTAARNDADAYAARAGVQPVDGGVPGPQDGVAHGELPLDHNGNVKLTGGVTLDGEGQAGGHAIDGIALDKQFPPFQKVGGHNVNMRWAVAQHEIFESWLMHHYGMGYEAAHHAATLHENNVVEARYPGLKGEDYQNAAKPYIEHIEQASRDKPQTAGLDPLPPDTVRTEEVKQSKARRGLASKKAPAPEQGNAPEPNATRSGNLDAIDQQLGGKASTDDIRDVRALVKNAQEGDTKPLHDRLQEMVDDGQISKTEAAILRREGRTRPSEAAKESASRALEDGATQRQYPPRSIEGRAAGEVSSTAESMLSKDPLQSGRARATELISKLREKFGASDPHRKAIDMLQWVLDKNPALAHTVKGVKAGPADSYYTGQFGAVTRIIDLSRRSDIHYATAVHEILHASESLLPKPIRDAIIGQWREEVRSTMGEGRPKEAAYFEYMHNAIKAKTFTERDTYQRAAKDELLDLRKRGDIDNARVKELYPLTNPSEFWAVHATDMLEHGYADRGLMQQAKEWLQGLVGKLRSLFKDTPNRSAVIDGLEHILQAKETGHAAFLRDYELTRSEFAGQPEAFSPMANAQPLHDIVTQTPKQTVATDDPITRFSELRAFMSETGVGFEKLDQSVRRLGLKLGSLYDESTTLGANREWLRTNDNHLVVEPAKAWVADNYHLFDMDPVKAVSKLGEFMQAHHQVTERMPMDWAKQVPLENGMEAVRDSIIQDTMDAKSTAEAQKSLARLKPLAEKHASIPLDNWKSELRDSMKKRLAELAQEGITPKTVEPFNKLVQDMEQRTHERRIESGFVAEDDRMSRANDYKWSTPQKGGAWDGMVQEPSDVQANELTSLRHAGKGKFAQPQVIHASQLRTAEGRATWAANTVVRSATDLQNAATDVANKRFLSFLQNMVEDGQTQIAERLKTETDPQMRALLAGHELNHTTIQPFTGTPYEGYTDVATGKHYDRLPAPERSVIHHDGRDHYVMQFPEGSKIMYSMEAMGTKIDWRDWPFLKSVIEGSEAVINAPIHAVNKLAGTHIADQTHLITRANRNFAQLITVFKPIWNLTTLLPRSLYEKMMMLGVKEGDGVADSLKLGADSLLHIVSGTFSRGTGSALVKLVSHDYEGITAMGKADPESWAGSWLKLQNEGGGNVFTQGFAATEDKNLFVAGIKHANRNVLTRRLHGYADWSRGFADMLENISSVGAFRTLVARGMDEHTAAAKTKQLLDFQKRGMAGDMLNGMHAFYRITASVNDTIYQAFQHKLGRHEQTIMGHKFTSGVNYHKLAMTTLLLGSYAGLKYMFDRALMGKEADGTSNMRKAIAQNPAIIVQRSFVPNPNDPDHPYMIAVGLGIPQILTAPGKILAAMTYGDITPHQAKDIMFETFQRNMSIVDPAGTPEDADTSTKVFAYALQAIMPTIGQQGYSLFSNTNSLGQNIHASHAVTDKYASDQGKSGTPEMWKEAAQHMQQTTGVDFFPETLQFLAHTFGGPLTDLARVTAGDSARETQGLERKGLGGVTGAKDFSADYYDSNRMYQTIDELTDSQRQLNAVQTRSGYAAGTQEAKDAGEQWLASNPKAQAKVEALKALEGAKKVYQTQIKAISTSNYTPEGKRLQRKQADSALRQATDAAQKALD